MTLYIIVALAGLASIPARKTEPLRSGLIAFAWSMALLMLLGRLYRPAPAQALAWVGCMLLGMAGFLQCKETPWPATEICLCACAMALLGYDPLWGGILLVLAQMLGILIGTWLPESPKADRTLRFCTGSLTIAISILSWPFWDGKL